MVASNALTGRVDLVTTTAHYSPDYSATSLYLSFNTGVAPTKSNSPPFTEISPVFISSLLTKTFPFNVLPIPTGG